jgi:hypothetical protein
MKKRKPEDYSPKVKKMIEAGINYYITILVLSIGIIIMLVVMYFSKHLAFLLL